MNVAFALDTSCVVPLLSSWHEFHEPTRRAYETRRGRHERLVLPASVLLESFAVLTRMPVRLSAPDALRLLEENFAESVSIAALAGKTAWASIRDLSVRGLAGGIVYDAAIAQAAMEAGATVLLTWNPKDFLRVASAGLEVRQP